MSHVKVFMCQMVTRVPCGIYEKLIGLFFNSACFVPIVPFAMNSILDSAQLKLKVVDVYVAMQYHILLIFKENAVLMFLLGWQGVHKGHCEGTVSGSGKLAPCMGGEPASVSPQAQTCPR